ncbi:DUF47 family protein [Nocardioides sp. YIM 152315]|uniref:DUF47 domain-containing protein n=1 Tax=Nocardioides sp. YIM 152315 TaxID=3031760 RepID=UPI0023D9928C|nr:DUF47 family protein [Nocardioides sp. YIM 152315]MDF1602624.1 DUF47 family protein [Nocardioides sp. YIM 152315]
MRNLTGRSDHDLTEVLLSQVQAVAAGSALALSVAAGEEAVAGARRRMTDLEHDGDEHRRRAVDLLSRSFTTPIDREDLFRLSRSIDDVLDNLRDFVRECDLLGVSSDDLLVDVLGAVAAAIASLEDAVRMLGSGRAEMPTAALSVRKNDIRQRYQTAMADLLSGELTTYTLRRRELLRRLDVVGLRLGEAADALADGAVKRSH